MKKKIFNILTLLAGVIFVADGIDILTSGDELPTFMIFIAWLDIIFFGLGTIVIIYHMFGPRRALPVSWNQHYLNIHSYFYRREIEWKHITGFSPYTWNGIDWILVHVDNVDDVMANTGNWFKRWSMKLALNQYGALYAIQAEHLTMTPEQFCNYLEQELAKHQPTVSAYM